MKHGFIALGRALALLLAAPAALAADLCDGPCSISIDFSSGGSISAPDGATITFGPEGGALELGEGGSITLGDGGSLWYLEGGPADMSQGGSIVLGLGGTIQFGPSGSLATGGAGGISAVGALAIDAAKSVAIDSETTVHLGEITAVSHIELTASDSIDMGATAPITLNVTDNIVVNSGGDLHVGNITTTASNSSIDVTVLNGVILDGSAGGMGDGSGDGSGSGVIVFAGGDLTCVCGPNLFLDPGLGVVTPPAVDPAVDPYVVVGSPGNKAGALGGLALLLLTGAAGLRRRLPR